jgi:hypothetical protein
MIGIINLDNQRKRNQKKKSQKRRIVKRVANQWNNMATAPKA